MKKRRMSEFKKSLGLLDAVLLVFGFMIGFAFKISARIDQQLGSLCSPLFTGFESVLCGSVLFKF